MSERKRLEEAIKLGGSVLHDNVLYMSESDLPDEADFAKGDPVAEQTAMTNMENEIKRLQEQMIKLQQRPEVTTEVKRGRPVSTDSDVK